MERAKSIELDMRRYSVVTACTAMRTIASWRPRAGASFPHPPLFGGKSTCQTPETHSLNFRSADRWSLEFAVHKPNSGATFVPATY